MLQAELPNDIQDDHGRVGVLPQQRDRLLGRIGMDQVSSLTLEMKIFENQPADVMNRVIIVYDHDVPESVRMQCSGRCRFRFRME